MMRFKALMPPAEAPRRTMSRPGMAISASAPFQKNGPPQCLPRRPLPTLKPDYLVVPDPVLGEEPVPVEEPGVDEPEPRLPGIVGVAPPEPTEPEPVVPEPVVPDVPPAPLVEEPSSFRQRSLSRPVSASQRAEPAVAPAAEPDPTLPLALASELPLVLLPALPPVLPLTPLLVPALLPALPLAEPPLPPDCAIADIANSAAAVAVTRSFKFICWCSCVEVEENWTARIGTQ